MKIQLPFLLFVLMGMALTTQAQNALRYVTNNGVVTVTGPVESRSAITNVVIPDTVGVYPVVNVAVNAFFACSNLTNVVIGNNVTNIGHEAFSGCINLTHVTMGSSMWIIGIGAFYSCTSLTNVTIPGSVKLIRNQAFFGCANLRNMIFLENAPLLLDSALSGVPGTVYYYYGTSGWGTTYGGLPTVMLGAPAPQIGGSGAVGVQSNKFGFTISGVIRQTIIVEASTNLVNWQPLWTNRLTGTSTNFTDLQWTNHPRRFYRVQSW